MLPTCELVDLDRTVNIAEGWSRIEGRIISTCQCSLHHGPRPHKEEDNCDAQGKAKKPPRRPRNSSDGKQYTHACGPSALFVSLHQSEEGTESHQVMQGNADVVIQKATTAAVPSTSYPFM
jgi:hypothetical protein